MRPMTSPQWWTCGKTMDDIGFKETVYATKKKNDIGFKETTCVALTTHFEARVRQTTSPFRHTVRVDGVVNNYTETGHAGTQAAGCRSLARTRRKTRAHW